MTEYPTESCRSCGADVIWCETDRGKSMPVDAAPVPGGNLAVSARALQRGPGRPLATVVEKKLTFGRRDLRKSHFSTCPHAGEWRNRSAS